MSKVREQNSVDDFSFYLEFYCTCYKIKYPYKCTTVVPPCVYSYNHIWLIINSALIKTEINGLKQMHNLHVNRPYALCS